MVQTRDRSSRKIIDDSSDLEEQRSTPNTTPKKQTVLPQRTIVLNGSPRKNTLPARPVASPSPKKPTRRVVRQSSSGETGTRSIQSFFKPGPPTRPVPLPVARSDSVPEASHEDKAIEEIEDSSGDDAVRPLRRATGLPANLRKRSSELGPGAGVLHPSQKFRKISNGNEAGVIVQETNAPAVHTARPWTEQYAPATLEELAVHKKKVSDVRQWLESVYSGKSIKRMLVLKGSAGTGKTCTVSLLAKALGVDLVEWSNPENTAGGGDTTASASAQFEEFVLRSRLYTGLEMVGLDGAPLKKTSSRDANSPNEKQAIVVEEFPHSITRSTDAVQHFRKIIAQFLAANTPGRSLFSSEISSPTPLILIMSESIVSGNSFGSDNFTAHRLIGQELLTHPGCTVIEFNPVAPTFITKGLSLVLQKHVRATGKRYNLHTQVLSKLSELGDIRNATSSTEFLCLQAPLDTSNVPGVAKSKSKSKTAKTSQEPADPASLSLLNLRESTLGLFHAVGKVMYNKRVPPAQPTEDLPPHLQYHTRPLESEVDIGSLHDSTGTDVATFVAALHENYALSCGTPSTSPNSEDTLDTIINCLDNLGDADILDASTSVAGLGGRAAYAGAETVKQSLLAFEVAVRGLLFSLPYPVKRASASSGSGGGGPASRSDAFRMFYPSSLRLWRRAEETTGRLDLVINRTRNGTLLPSAPMPPRFSTSTSTSLALDPSTQQHRSSFSISQPGRSVRRSVYASPPKSISRQSTPSQPLPAPEETPSHHPTLGSGISPRLEMLLDRLPYLSLLHRSSPPTPQTTALLSTIDALTRFRGFASDSLAEEVDTSTGESTGVQNVLPVRSTVVKKEREEERTVLSDDDIEDSDME